jgi:hypothetical protein
MQAMSRHYIEPSAQAIEQAQAQGFNVYAETETGIHLIDGDVYDNDSNDDGEQETYAGTVCGLRQVQASFVHIVPRYKI